jgi:hypothetical protein
MSGSFKTDEAHGEDYAPVHAAILKEYVYQEAKDLVDDLPGWTLVEADEDGTRLVCERKGGLLAGDSRVEIRCDGPAGIPSCTVEVESTSTKGLRSRDRANVAEFVRPFRRRIC